MVIVRKYGKGFKKFCLNNNLDIYILIQKIVEILKFCTKERRDIFKKIQLSSFQKKQIQTFYKKYYGRKIPFIWHRHYMAFTNSFSIDYFPEYIYTSEFEYLMNYNRLYCRCIADKNMLALLATGVGIAMPKSFISVSASKCRDTYLNFLTYQEALDIFNNIGEAFIKPTVGTSSGIGCRVVNNVNGIDLISGQCALEIFSKMGTDFVVQERVRIHKTLSTLCPMSVNTFRVMTYWWKDSISYAPVILRIGRGDSYLDNAHAGGIFIAVNDDGELARVAFTEFNQKFMEHPDTHIVFEGYRVCSVDKVIKAAIKMHLAVPQVGVINWDFTVDLEGNPILIEANTEDGGIWLIEMAHGRGPFGDNTRDILCWLNNMKKIKKRNRKQHYFGK